MAPEVIKNLNYGKGKYSGECLVRNMFINVGILKLNGILSALKTWMHEYFFYRVISETGLVTELFVVRSLRPGPPPPYKLKL